VIPWSLTYDKLPEPNPPPQPSFPYDNEQDTSYYSENLCKGSLVNNLKADSKAAAAANV